MYTKQKMTTESLTQAYSMQACPNLEFYKACEMGDIVTAKKELLKEEKLTEDILGYAFSRACFEGHLELVKWILLISPFKAIISHKEHMPIREACRNKKAHVAEWIESLKPHLYAVKHLKNGKVKVTIHNSAKTFYNACFVGDLVTAKMLLIANPKMALSKKELNNTFALSCLKGFLELAQWLLSVKPNIDISWNGDFALKAALEYGHTEIVDWLTEIKAK